MNYLESGVGLEKFPPHGKADHTGIEALELATLNYIASWPMISLQINMVCASLIIPILAQSVFMPLGGTEK